MTVYLNIVIRIKRVRGSRMDFFSGKVIIQGDIARVGVSRDLNVYIHRPRSRYGLCSISLPFKMSRTGPRYRYHGRRKSRRTKTKRLWPYFNVYYDIIVLHKPMALRIANDINWIWTIISDCSSMQKLKYTARRKFHMTKRAFLNLFILFRAVYFYTRAQDKLQILLNSLKFHDHKIKRSTAGRLIIL